MNVEVLIDSIVRQTTVLIAQLGTAAGVRAPLSHVANQVFLDLASELREQGLGQKVIADMFGLALRTYHEKVRRLSESSTFSGCSLWESILEFIQGKGTVLRADVLQRFRNDDSATVRAIVKDLVEGGMVFQSGRNERMTYRAATPDEYRAIDPVREREGLVNFVWVALNRFAPATAAELSRAIPLPAPQVSEALDTLVADGRARRLADTAEARYECTHCVIALGSELGWEAAVFDHFQAMVTAICNKVRAGATVAEKGDLVGGSTYGIVVWPGHPLREETFGLLASLRAQVAQQREKVVAYNVEHAAPEATERVIVYVGQSVQGLEDDVETTDG